MKKDTGARNKPKPAKHHDGVPGFLKGWLPLAWFAVAAFVIFGQAIGFDYTFMDDQTLVMNQMEKMKSASAISRAFEEDAFHLPPGGRFYFRPVLTLSFIADARIGNGSFSMFHVSNIVYHILASFLLFLLFTGLGFERIRSFVFSLVFLVHPLASQVVGWVPGRNDSLLAIFLIGSFLAWIRYMRDGGIPYLLLHASLFFLALLTKENAIAIPVLMVCYSVARLRKPVKSYILPAVGWIVALLLWIVLRQRALGGSGDTSYMALALSVFKNLPGILPYLGKAFFPFDLSVFPILADMKVSFVLGILALAGIIALVVVTRPKQWSWYLLGSVWFLALLLPSFVSVSSIVRDYSEHRGYLPLAGLLLLFMATGPVINADFRRSIPLMIAAGIILLFGFVSFRHTRFFQDRFTFWQNAVETSPSHAFNYNNLGAMYFLENDFGNAEKCFRKALQLNPFEPMANSNTGLVCMNTGRPAEAEQYYLEEIRINPTYEDAYYNLGLLYAKNSRIEEATQEWEKILTINPAHDGAIKMLLYVYGNFHRTEDYDRILKLAQENGINP